LCRGVSRDGIAAEGSLRLAGSEPETEFPKDGEFHFMRVEYRDYTGNRGFGCCTVAVPHSAAPAALLSVQAQAAAARAFCRANAGTPPAGYFVVGDDPQQ